MHRMLLFVSVLSLALFAQSSEISKEESKELKEKCGLRPNYDKDSYKIFGGRRAKPGQYPWAADIFMNGPRGWEHGCGGTLITKRHVLTAAHCTHRDMCRGLQSVKDYKIYIGSLKAGEGEEFAVRSIVHHPVWGSPQSVAAGCMAGGDVAIMELERDVTERLFSEGKAGFGCLPSTADMSFGHYPLVALGWGLTLNDATKHDLMWTRLSPMTREVCQAKTTGSIPNDTVCVAELNSNVCRGDSGGPLLQKSRRKPKRFHIMGVVSFGTECAEMKANLENDESEYSGGQFTDIRMHLGWICKHSGACYSVAD